MKVRLIFQNSRRLLSILNQGKIKGNNFQKCDKIYKDEIKGKLLISNIIFYILHIKLAFVRGRDL
ncbi:hypothetical protein [Saccharolobus caldissimus]|uniref:Uncharacterized protein n=1 Tax=Saccharolobus caldissimus TaxID=1702097 RepID=A0AAQ4CV90_9CREN|nr:hypothetical protein [Saccharolobus caldissimus]BDB99721.1 hypothetical protein SACC_27380 [Saccharolobus caldissimus]